MNLAPVVLFVYNRPWHTKQTLDALSKNNYANETELFVFIDGPKIGSSIQEIEKIEEVKKIVEAQTWAKTIKINIAENNIGCRNSIIKGISEILKIYDKAIIVEDDIYTSPYFLSYMNTCLNYYKERPSVYSISAHCPPPEKVIVPKDYLYDVYAFTRPFNWGWGTWSDRWFQENWNKSFIPDFLEREQEVKAFNRSGEDLSKMLREEAEGKSDAWDIQFSFTHFKNHGLSIIPCKSYVKNIGLDGTGTHCSVVTNDKTDISMAVENPKLLDVLYLDSRIMNAIYSYFYPKKRALWKKAVNKLCRIFGMNSPFVIKKKIYY